MARRSAGVWRAYLGAWSCPESDRVHAAIDRLARSSRQSVKGVAVDHVAARVAQQPLRQLELSQRSAARRGRALRGKPFRKPGAPSTRPVNGASSTNNM